MVNRIRYCLWLLWLLWSQAAPGQSLYTQKLVPLLRQPPGPVRDSLVVHYLFTLSKLITPDQDKWIDSLRSFSQTHQNTLGYLLWQVIDSEKIIRTLNFREGIRRHLAFGRALENRHCGHYANWSYLRAGIIFARPSSEFVRKKDALVYYQKALDLSIASRDTAEIGRAYDYIGEYYLDIKRPEQALFYLKKAEILLQSHVDKYMYPTVLASMGSCYLLLKNEKAALLYYEQMSYWLNDSGLLFKPFYRGYIMNIYHYGFADYYYKANQYDRALRYARNGYEAMQTFDKVKNKRTYDTYVLDHLRILYQASARVGAFEKAFAYLNEFHNIQNSHTKSDLNKEFQALNEKYQSEQKQLKISQLETEKIKIAIAAETRTRYFLLALLGLVSVGLGFAFWSNGRIRAKNRAITQAHLQGQTLERRRVAADLHDNLGSTLASLNFALAALNTSQLSPPEQTLYAAISQQLRQAYGDLRLLAHNLMPDELAKHGLPTALTGLVAKLNRSTALTVRLDLPTDPGPLRADARTEFEVYSVCMELVNNALKHAHATEIGIGLSRQNHHLILTVADNGVGLPANLPQTGAGLQNVQARVAGLGGQWQTGTGASGSGLLNTVTVPFCEPA
jgi:two-component system, NarL family, sensor kinase